ncbi:hypothetical protein ACFVKC_24070 [Streptomyces noursei]|uniref:hypothetical protein n=1 Tax=Streptomyces noursei TaxID=1971 RepID=UPI0036319B81
MAAHALTAPTPPNTDWILTGPQALSYDAVAAVLTEVTGRPVRHRSVSVEEMRARHARVMPPEFATVWPTWTAGSPTAPRTGPPTPSHASPAGHPAPSPLTPRTTPMP